MQEIMKKYRSRLITEGIIKALLYAALFALSALAVSALVFWMIGFELVWVAAIIFAGVLVVSAPVLYFAAFRPTEKSIARRMDKDLGLDERIVTMLEYRGSSDVMLCAQRANAVSALKKSNGKKITLAVFSTALIIGLASAFVIGAGTTTVSALTATGVIPSGVELLEGKPEEPAKYKITYVVSGTGLILGTLEQEVIQGENATSVIAVPGVDDEGEWYFVGWSDGVTDPYRVDKNVSSDITVVATFALVGAEEDFEIGDSSPQIPLPPGENEGDENGPSSDQEPIPGGETEPGMDGNGPGGTEGGGQSSPNNQVIDGETYYGGSTYDNAYNDAQGEMEDNDNISDKVIGIVGDYAGSIQH